MVIAAPAHQALDAPPPQSRRGNRTTRTHRPQQRRRAEINEQGHRLPFSFLHWPEVAKAFWTGHPERAAAWDRLKMDLSEGQTLYRAKLDADMVAQRAAGLMRNFAPRWPKLRALDVMHVSAAVESGAKTFLSFDKRSYQRLLAHTQKLKVWPALTSEESARLK